MTGFPDCPVCGDPVDYCLGHPAVRELAYEIENGLIKDADVPRRLAWLGITEDQLDAVMS